MPELKQYAFCGRINEVYDEALGQWSVDSAYHSTSLGVARGSAVMASPKNHPLKQTKWPFFFCLARVCVVSVENQLSSNNMAY